LIPPSFFLSLFLSLRLPPGPGVFVILARALTAGATACYPLAFGMAISDILYLIMATLGLAAIAENWGELFTVIRLVGALYLFYLGWKMWTAKIETKIKPNMTKGAGLSGFIQGFLVSISNPKVILFYIAFLPTFMDLKTLNKTDLIVVSALTFIAVITGLMLIAFSGASARQKFQSRRGMTYLNRIAGMIMMSAGVFLALFS
jgi:threonine/homoserine/homoserine lactone efflux protein